MSDDAVVLDPRERQLVRAALLDWGGPANPTDELAIAMGYGSASSLPSEAWALWKRIEANESLSASDWKRVLLAVEIVFASDVVGSGLDWAITSGISDEESVEVLRGLQRKLPRWRNSVQFEVDEEAQVRTLDVQRPDS